MEFSASKFKAQCLRLLDLVNENQTDIVITKRGKPVARLVPFTPGEPAALLGCLSGMGSSSEEIVESTQDEWSLDGC